MLPFLVRHSAWQTAHYQVKSDGKTSYERLRGRPYQGQVAEFAEVVHFRDPGKAADMPKLDDQWSLALWLGKSLASDEHYVGTSAGVRRCRSIWRRPENQRWGRKMLNEMIGDPWNPASQAKKKPQVPHGVYITLDRQIKYGGTKGCPAYFGHAKVHLPECRARFQDIVDIKAAQTGAASSADAEAETSGRAAGGSAPSSSSGVFLPASLSHLFFISPSQSYHFCTVFQSFMKSSFLAVRGHQLTDPLTVVRTHSSFCSDLFYHILHNLRSLLLLHLFLLSRVHLHTLYSLQVVLSERGKSPCPTVFSPFVYLIFLASSFSSPLQRHTSASVCLFCCLPPCTC